LPQSWLQHSFEEYERLVAKLDFGRQGYILLKDLFTVIILSDCQLPTADQLDRYCKDLSKAVMSGPLTTERFASVAAWFDQSQ